MCAKNAVPSAHLIPTPLVPRRLMEMMEQMFGCHCDMLRVTRGNSVVNLTE